ncbi:type IV secretion system DNA-binding domain-containing protein [Aerosakkonemataceae cyanobacterium BLCC-F50]|uniref:Type IV secretion system DNA-binding domain-containing protein n=1 Tax=Floridaenema flaviceps BLCC-F50 TaxID=3153642 RepID=A0ABV4XIU6_9CYAN
MNQPHSSRALRNQIIPSSLCGALVGSGIAFYISARDLILFMLAGGGASTGVTVLVDRRKRKLNQTEIGGRESVSSETLNQHLERQQKQYKGVVNEPRLKLANVRLTTEQEWLNIFIVGRAGAGKTQALIQLLDTLRQRSDFRVVILDRNGEMLRYFYRDRDLIFNPLDARSVTWSHTEEMRSLPALEIANSFIPIPEDTQDKIWYKQAQLLLANIWKKTANNEEVRQIINGSAQDMRMLLHDTPAIQCFEDPKLAASVRFTLNSQTECYEYLSDRGQPLSFYEYGRSDDRLWLFLPLLEGQTSTLKTPLSAAIDLVIRGILSKDPYPMMKTAIVIDELGALQKLPTLERLLAEGRKFGGTAIIGTQTDAQMTKTYGIESTRILLQNTFTKLILNCPDAETSQRMADLIGKRRYWETRVAINHNLGQGERSENIHHEKQEEYTVQPTELQMLPNLEGYLVIGGDNPVAKIRVPIHTQAPVADAFVPRSI